MSEVIMENTNLEDVGLAEVLETPSMDLADVTPTQDVAAVNKESTDYAAGYTDGFGDRASQAKVQIKNAKTKAGWTGAAIGAGVTFTTLALLYFWRKNQIDKIKNENSKVTDFEEFKDCEVEAE